ncbi:MAG: Cellulophaga phage phi46:3 [Bacteroidota bacterium]|jgi:hypothetical protein
MNYTVYRLITGKLDGTYSIKRSVGLRNGVLKDISYRPGTDSIFDEDNKGSIVAQKEVVFEYNDILSDPAVEIVVPNANQVLNAFIRAHAKYDVDFTEHNPDAVAKEKSKSYDDIAKALEYVNVGSSDEISASALAVFGISHFQKSVEICKADLKEKAIKEPKVIIEVFEAPDFQNKYLASLAFCSGIIVNNNTNTAILWSDSSEPILTIAKGENGIQKLTELLSVTGQESEVLLQEFQNRLDKKGSNTVSSKDTSVLLKSKDDEIADLKKQLAKANDIKVNGAEILTGDTSLLRSYQQDYFEKFGKEVPARYKNDKDWIVEKLSE